MRRDSFQKKLSRNFILLTIVILATLTFLFYERAINLQKEDLRKSILANVRLISFFLDADKLSRIKPDPASEQSAEYIQAREELERLRNTNPLIDSVYTMVGSDKEDTWLFLVDSGDKRGIKARCGEPYNVSDRPEMRLAFQGPSVDKKLNSDKWGAFLSGYAPIRDREGKAVAIVGIDVKAESITLMQRAVARRFFLVMVLGIGFSLFLGWFFARGFSQPIHSLIKGVKELGRGNLEYKVYVQTKDELGDLADAFNNMSGDLREARDKLQQLYLETIKSLALALEAKDRYTKGHSERVMRYSVGIAKQMGLLDKEVDLLEEVSILHDIGKIGMPDSILSKPGPLSEEEEKKMHEHPGAGEKILKPIEFLKPGLSVVSEHHERVDGKGYPAGLKGNEITLLAAIVAVADSWDAMTTDRPYRKALSKEEAQGILEKNKGTQFCPEVVDAFIAYLRNQKPETSNLKPET